MLGYNTLTISNGDLSKTYEFKVNQDKSSSLLLTDEEYIIPMEYLDFDGDGIPNLTEKNEGLATYSNDTDNDGLLDNVELVMGLDPKKKDDYNTSRKYTVYQDDYQILQLLNRGWAYQSHQTSKLIAEHFKLSSQGKYYDYEKQVKAMVAELESGSPTMLGVEASIGNHSVMATNVYKTNDLEKYIICIYDSNTPGTEAKMYLERQVSSKKFSETSYYSMNFTSAGIKFYKMLYEKS